MRIPSPLPSKARIRRTFDAAIASPLAKLEVTGWTLVSVAVGLRFGVDWAVLAAGVSMLNVSGAIEDLASSLRGRPTDEPRGDV